MSQTAQRWKHLLCRACWSRACEDGLFQRAPIRKSGVCCQCGQHDNIAITIEANPLELNCAGRTGIHEEK